ncbi:HAD-IIA family hydrolase [Natrialbaceae archaeon GCM10025810]|uniref:HAD-IIA family hydrolase n=1 Tax=Halovalidus salilacus TaxID=3075124 RepID=UPI003605E70F
MTEFGYEAAILDVDGTIVRGDELIPGVPDGLRALEGAGCARLLFSNNPTRGGAHYRERLAPYGIDVEPQNALTSATVSAEFLARTHPDETVFLVGENRLQRVLEDAGLEVTRDPDEAEVVLGSYDHRFSYDVLRDALGALAGEVPFYGTDPDVTIPTDDGAIPGSGSILAAMEAVAGREPDAILGKPSSVAALAAMDRLGVRPNEGFALGADRDRTRQRAVDGDDRDDRSLTPERVLVVGDRLNTDIALGARAGMGTALVLSGITERDEVGAGEFEPDHVLESLADVGELFE